VDVDARVEALELENDRLRDEIERLRSGGAAFGFIPPAEWRLTQKETRVLEVLLRLPMASKDQIMAGCYVPGADDEPMIKIVDVFICKMRRKLRPFAIEIRTLWGVGYTMDAEAKAKCRAAGEAVMQGMAA
jgi:DNA-binding response OmpR family regulator